MRVLVSSVGAPWREHRRRHVMQEGPAATAVQLKEAAQAWRQWAAGTVNKSGAGCDGAQQQRQVGVRVGYHGSSNVSLIVMRCSRMPLKHRVIPHAPPCTAQAQGDTLHQAAVVACRLPGAVHPCRGAGVLPSVVSMLCYSFRHGVPRNPQHPLDAPARAAAEE